MGENYKTTHNGIATVKKQEVCFIKTDCIASTISQVECSQLALQNKHKGKKRNQKINN